PPDPDALAQRSGVRGRVLPDRQHAGRSLLAVDDRVHVPGRAAAVRAALSHRPRAPRRSGVTVSARWGDAWRRVRAAVDRRATPRTLLVAGFLVFLLYAYPGYLTTESANQLVDARTGNFTDWQSPVMSGVWWVVEGVVAGSFGMLALQSALVFAGAYHLIRRVVPARAAALAACCVLLWPPVLAPLAVVWRDGQMAGFLLAGAAAVISPRRPWKLVGLALLLLGCAMRDAAAVAALPVIVLGFAWRDGQRSGSRAAIAVVVWAAVALGAGWLDDALTASVTQRPQVALATADIAAMLRFGPTLDDAELQRL